MNFPSLGKTSGPLFQALEILLVACALTGCARQGFDEARQLVERYNHVVSEAYRRGDAKLIEGVVGPREGKKLTGLIGVRQDLGLTLDSQLLALEVTAAARTGDELRVRTQERWSYRDRKIGTGEQVGADSTDAYEMNYLFRKINDAWLVDEIQFAAPPQVGRTTTPWVADGATLHGAAGGKKP